MATISALALSFTFVFSPVLALMCELQCAPTAATAAAPAGGCHAASTAGRLSFDDTGAPCAHDAALASLAAASERDARLGQAHTASAALDNGKYVRQASAPAQASPPGFPSAPSPVTLHSILRV
jgi:hypothetical protein